MKLKRAFNSIVIFFLLIGAVTVLVASVATTVYYDMGSDVDRPVFGKENIPLLLLLTVAVFIVFFVLRRMGYLLDTKRRLLMAALLFSLFYCLMLIFLIKPRAVNDSLLLDNAINEFMTGDYSSLTEKDGYLYIWPFQLGYVLFGQIMYRLFGPSNYLAWDLVQLASILITVFLLYCITYELFEDREVCGIMAILSFGILFFYNYVTYIYGDILSMAPQTIALYLMILYLKRKRSIYALGSGAAIACAVVIKTNCEIALIALIMVMCLDINDKKGVLRVLLLSAAMIAMVFGAKYGVNNYYLKLTGLQEIPAGSPAASHIAMGLQESELEDGWYNGYNYKVFGSNGYDSEAAKAESVENIKESLQRFVSNPKYAVKFFGRKFISQWADPVCISTHNLDLVSRHVEDQPAMAQFIVFGDGMVFLSQVMNVFMTVCYLCVAVFLVMRLVQRNGRLPEMLLLILILGGMVFHEFWEGSSRYVMRYYIYWLPYAAYGMNSILKKINR
ncbi:glycosyltransferase family 39 protein [Butyrivibrio sp. MC2021]|uniref:glycosyltransferase family 39 protein n=1 Tax=Butyrivibrio sp. MC2021 TaxID=1408306 RepID=UPI00047AE3B1|nr:glycosyltransferase family 39 protein [Butyrivibrio sp. MC2021]